MSVDLTGVIVALIGGFFSVVTLIVGSWITSHFKDNEAKATLSTAIKNALGAMQQAAEAAAQGAKPTILVPGMSQQMSVGIQYVLDHAGEEAKRLNITSAAIAQKIIAQVGLLNIQSNIAAASHSTFAFSPLAAVRAPPAIPTPKVKP